MESRAALEIHRAVERTIIRPPTMRGVVLRSETGMVSRRGANSALLKTSIGREKPQKSQKRRIGFARFEPFCGHSQVFPP